MSIWNADTFVALTLSETLGDDGITPDLSLQLSDARTLVVLGLESLLALQEEPGAEVAKENCPLLPSAMTGLGNGTEWIYRASVE